MIERECIPLLCFSHRVKGCESESWSHSRVFVCQYAYFVTSSFLWLRLTIKSRSCDFWTMFFEIEVLLSQIHSRALYNPFLLNSIRRLWASLIEGLLTFRLTELLRLISFTSKTHYFRLSYCCCTRIGIALLPEKVRAFARFLRSPHCLFIGMKTLVLQQGFRASHTIRFISQHMSAKLSVPKKLTDDCQPFWKQHLIPQKSITNKWTNFVNDDWTIDSFNKTNIKMMASACHAKP